MGIEDIQKRIIEEAIKKASSIMKEEESNLKNELESFRQEELDRIKREKDNIINSLNDEFKRKIESLKLESDNRVLAEKRKLLDDFYEKILQKILTLDKDRYINFIKHLIDRDVPKNENSVIFLSESDLKRFRKDIEKYVSERYSGKVSISKSPVKIKGGILIKSSYYEIDDSVESIISEVREKSEIEYAKKLFEG